MGSRVRILRRNDKMKEEKKTKALFILTILKWESPRLQPWDESVVFIFN